MPLRHGLPVLVFDTNLYLQLLKLRRQFIQVHASKFQTNRKEMTGFLKIVKLCGQFIQVPTKFAGSTRYPHEIHPPKKFIICRGILSYDEIGLATNKIRL